jgi:GrpB-like predicted nucleotidyltransferase (UPF0157 family)
LEASLVVRTPTGGIFDSAGTAESAVQRKDLTMKNSIGPRRPDVTTVELFGGTEPLHVQLHPYDTRWGDIYIEHRNRIIDAMLPEDVDVEHIGSTSVPGLSAKPIVDIVIAVADITAEEDYLAGLLAAGYELRTREPGHRLVRTPTRDVQVHIYERGHTAIDEYLLLRDRLRSDIDDRALYQNVKQQLMTQQWGDTNEYADAKTDVIQAIKNRARISRL